MAAAARRAAADEQPIVMVPLHEPLMVTQLVT
jgi:hypothetical protein